MAEIDKTKTSAAQKEDLTAASAKPATSASGAQPILEKIGPYVLLERLGEGGMGTVYTAYDPQLDRKVAIKLLRPEEQALGLAESQARLLREAQAMARLDNPHVVAVHAAGTHLDRVYIVMDRIEGQTLKEWLAEKPREWRVVLEVFLQAGKGLAAAHAAGIVHRDFKPSNVLVGKDGRVRVTDFGIARAIGQAPEQLSTTSSSSNDETEIARGAMETPLTVAGTVLGTPRYMAPEQSLGQAGDPRSDQFSFCVALYEALFHARPFEKAFNPLAPRKAKEPSKPGGVPAFVRQAVLRGLCTLPDDRFAGMDELLRTLDRKPRRWLALGAASAGLLALGILVTHQLEQRRAAIAGCDAAGRSLGSFWNDGIREKLRNALANAAASPSSIDAALRQLDGYAKQWTSTEATACESLRTHDDGNALLAVSCLSRQRNELDALVQVLLQGDKEVAANAARASDSLFPPSNCMDARALAALPKLPPDPKVRREVDALRVKLSTIEALRFAGKRDEAAAKAAPIVAAARALGYLPLVAEALDAQASAEGGEAAIASLEDAEQAAEACGADGVAAQAGARLALSLANAGRAPEAQRWIGRSRALLERTGGGPLAEENLESAEAQLSAAAGKDEETLVHARRAVEITTAAYGPDHLRTLNSLGNLGVAYINIFDFEGARTTLQQTMEREERVLGEDSVARVLPCYIEALARTGRQAEAEAAITRDEAIFARVGTSDFAYGELLTSEAELRLDEGRFSDGLETARRASVNALANSGPASDDYAEDLGTEGAILEAEGKHAEAVKLLLASLDAYHKFAASDAIPLVDPLNALAAAQIGVGKPKLALPLAEQALDILGKHHTSPGQLAAARFALARALVATHGDAARAADLAKLARDELAKLPWKQRQLNEVTAWLRQHKIT